ncbi:cell division protein FtsL [Roseovarius tibetensis]|uniref:cell division protein FtsL n=1 Tax=Roseovarius tibetensis TaxID=2685897 RepID=UPI003D7F41D4
MRSLLYVLTSLAVIGLAFWAYRENYRTQEAQDRAQHLQQALGDARQRLRVLNAEWAYLNRPDRLMDLVEMNYESLGLMPMQPYQFGRIDQVAFPPPPALPITNPVDVSNMEPAQ